LNIIVKVTKEAKIVLDCAPSQFYKNGRYVMKMGTFGREELLKILFALDKEISHFSD